MGLRILSRRLHVGGAREVASSPSCQPGTKAAELQGPGYGHAQANEQRWIWPHPSSPRPLGPAQPRPAYDLRRPGPARPLPLPAPRPVPRPGSLEQAGWLAADWLEGRKFLYPLHPREPELKELRGAPRAPPGPAALENQTETHHRTSENKVSGPS